MIFFIIPHHGCVVCTEHWVAVRRSATEAATCKHCSGSRQLTCSQGGQSVQDGQHGQGGQGPDGFDGHDG